jgi:NAD(P)-dependent dehydrogenase (short-subunit alcohol dehydrogenase family)
MRLQGRRIVITGAASGIGAETARLFRREGAAVGLIDLQADPLQATAAALAQEPGAAIASAVADVADGDAVDAAIATIAAGLGGLDGVVSSAGIDLLRPFGEMTRAEWQRVLDVDLTGPMNVFHAALPSLRRAGGGTIVAISSGAGLRPLEHRTAYCSAKAGLVMLCKAMAMDLSADEIRVNAICPGIIETPLFRTSFERHADPQSELKRILDRYVIKRIGRPDDIAAAALYLTSDESSYVTGSALAVDGGRTFH